MSNRKDNIKFKIENGRIRGYVDNKKKDGVSEMQYIIPWQIEYSPTILTSNLFKIIVEPDEPQDS